MFDIEVVKMSTGGLRGYTTKDDESWHKFKKWLENLEAGEFFNLEVYQPRNPKLHRKFFALLRYGFDHWEPELGRKRLTYRGQPIEKSFEAYREQVIILAGYYEQSFTLKGEMQVRAKSIAFHAMGDEEFTQLYEAAVDVVRKHILTNYTREDLDEVLAHLERFGE
jgi:hypothetical protein